MNDSSPTPHRRRVRYAGTHPRRFADKYKEHQPERYAADVQKIIASGKTLAGTHRPICLREILQILAPQPGETAVDATIGYGGHAIELLRALQPGGRLLGLDADPLELPRTEARLRAAGFPPESILLRRTNFAGLSRLLAAESIQGVDLVLADLGVSSMQLDNPFRGFSYKLHGPLDLRLNPLRGPSAANLLANATEPELTNLLVDNADEPRARDLARALCDARAKHPINTTTDLTRLLRRVLPPSRDTDTSIRRVFQALRIAVNDEFSALETFLRQLPACLRPGARVAILTFHSGEDRRVKKSFEAGQRDHLYAQISREIIRPSAEEIRSNPRASSAKLRWAIRA